MLKENFNLIKFLIREDGEKTKGRRTKEKKKIIVQKINERRRGDKEKRKII